MTEQTGDYQAQPSEVTGVTFGMSTRFKPGQSGNPKGRPPKGETFMDVLAKRVGERKVQLAMATVREAEKGNVRALTFIRDTLYGLPAQKLKLEVEDSPLSQLMRMWKETERELGASDTNVSRETLPAAIDAEYHVVDEQ